MPGRVVADGSKAIASVYRATVEWHGRSRTVPALAVGGDPLIGMALLAGSRLRMDAVPGIPPMLLVKQSASG